MRFNNDPVNAGIDAIRKDATILQISGWHRWELQKGGINAISDASLNEGADIAGNTGITRTSAGSWRLRKN